MSRPIPPATISRAVDAYIAAGGNVTIAARKLGASRTTIQHHIERARDLGLVGEINKNAPDEGLLKINESLRCEVDRLNAALKDAAKTERPHFTVRQDNISRSAKIRVVCIGDAHDSPAIPDKSRFEWIGQYIGQEKPDIVVQIGDFATLDSLNTHVPNETFQGKSKPTFMADMVSFNEALDAMNLGGVERHCTLGNHERRLYLFEDRAPEAYGMMQFELQKIFENHKWTFSPYGQITLYGGVGFVHVPLNRLGKSIGGKNAENTTANELLHDLVFGHSHIERTTRYSKIGPNNFVISCNVGCALPQGHVEGYAEHAMPGGWSWGIMDMTIQHGHIQERNWITMARLEERYGRKAA